MIKLYNSNDRQVYVSRDTDIPNNENILRKEVKYTSTCYISENILMPDRYTLSVSAFVEKVKLIHPKQSVLNFYITRVESRENSLKPWRKGIISPVYDWKVSELHEKVF